ncbi:MAG: MoxR family ATPase [bacterium]|nr:MoxR family ATPase [bacterium]
MATISVKKVFQIYEKIRDELSKVLLGQDDIIDQVIIALFAGGHVLIEGVPGLGKTLLANALTYIIGGEFKRIQFTPDLMPSDIIGTTVYNADIKKFQVKKGPVFTNLLLADEINRAPAKTQSALLQAMQERTVTIDGKNYPLGKFFICLATQNPIEMEGTYPLPEAQIDRFLMKINIEYPPLEEERGILAAYRDGFTAEDPQTAGLNKIIGAKDIESIMTSVQTVKVDDQIIEYITNIVSSTRNFPGIEIGSSPRGSVALLQASRVKAILSERDFVIPDDVKDLVPPILRHRIILESEAEIEGVTPDDYLKRIIEEIEVPR